MPFIFINSVEYFLKIVNNLPYKGGGNMGLYEAVSNYARDMNLSIRKVEQQAGLGNGTIRSWNESSPSLSSVEKVAKVFGITSWKLLKDSEK